MNMFIEYMYRLSSTHHNIHMITEIYCSRCGQNNINDDNNRCGNCSDSDLYFVCENCTDIIRLDDFYDLCKKSIEEKVVKIQTFYKKRIFIKKLLNYRNNLLKLYFHPDSIYIKYYINNFNKETKRNLMAYINNNNKLLILKME